MIQIIYQIGIVFAVCWAARCIEAALPFDFPASVIGMLLLFLLLYVRIVKVEHIRQKSDFLLSNMAFFFLPAAVSIINYFPLLKQNVIPLLAVCFISTIVTFCVTAAVVTLALKLLKKTNKHKDIS